MYLLNILFIIVIVISAVFYLYFKTKQHRTHYPIRKKWYQSKAGTSLGLFISSFGVNTAFIYQDALTYIIGAIFISLGSFMISSNIKRMRHEGKFIKEEYELNHNKT